MSSSFLSAQSSARVARPAPNWPCCFGFTLKLRLDLFTELLPRHHRTTFAALWSFSENLSSRLRGRVPFRAGNFGRGNLRPCFSTAGRSGKAGFSSIMLEHFDKGGGGAVGAPAPTPPP